MAGRVTVRERRLALEGRDARVVGEVTDSIRDAVGERIILRVDFGHARSAAAGERTINMADLRRCIGSARFGIEAHDTPVDDFPQQSSQKDGLGRMCAIHWNAYTAGLARDAKARKAAAEAQANAAPDAHPAPTPKRGRHGTAPVPADAQGEPD